MTALIVSANDLGGGAGIAAFRLHKALQKTQAGSHMYVQRCMSGSPDVASPHGSVGKVVSLLQPHIDRAPARWFGPPTELFHAQWFPRLFQPSLQSFDADLINLHWICDGFQSIESLGHLKLPVVWTLHDMWPMTGGCHYSDACTRYQTGCGRCPILGSRREADLSRWVWRRKHRVWKDLDLTIVTPSRWMAQCAAESALFREKRIEVIPNGVDLEVFKPIDQTMARQILNLPEDVPLVLFGAMSGSSRKGAHHLREALTHMRAIDPSVELAVFGNRQQENELAGLRTHYLGRLSDETSLCLAYAAADVFVAPSEQDNLPNTMTESLACGTPCVAFDIGGMSDIIEHGETGYLAKPFDAGDLAKGMLEILRDPQGRPLRVRQARSKAVACYDVQRMARRYLDVFTDVKGH